MNRLPLHPDLPTAARRRADQLRERAIDDAWCWLRTLLSAGRRAPALANSNRLPEVACRS